MRVPAKFTLILNLGIFLSSVFAVHVDAKELSFAALLSGHQQKVLSSREFSLTNRYADAFVNGVFKDNILLNIAYLSGKVKKTQDIKWPVIQKPFVSEITLKPGEVFAYHDTLLPEYQGKIVKTTNAHFGYAQGFRSSGYLYGDGVCHLASLINWVAKDAGLTVKAPTNHDFANIPQVPREYGVSIYYSPANAATSAIQNLYIENTLEKPVTFKFVYENDKLTVSVYKSA